MAKKTGDGLAGFRPQRENANAHTLRGTRMLAEAMARSGYVTPMTAAADGEVIVGSNRLNVAADVFDGVEPIVVHSDGTRPIIHVRDDIPSADDERAVRIALEDNRIAEVGLAFDPDVIAAIAARRPEALLGLWDDGEIDAFHLGNLPSLDDLEARYGQLQEEDTWPFIRLQVSPDVLGRWEELMGLAPGEQPSDRLGAVLAAVDPARLAGA